MKQVALVTGAHGFVGKHLQAELRAFGYEVFGIGREKIMSDHDRCVDVTDAAAVAEAVRQIAPTHIFHLASIGIPREAELHPDTAQAVSVLGTRHVLDAAARLPAPPRILITGSAQVYGRPRYLPIDEAHPLQPVGVYAETKMAQEAVAREFMTTLPIVLTRSFNHTGPGQSDAFVVPKIMKQLVEMRRGVRALLELGNIQVKRDILDVRDTVRAYRLLLESPGDSGVYNVCRGSSMALEDVIEYGKHFAGLQDIQYQIDTTSVRSHDVPDLYGSNAALKARIDWTPAIGCKEMCQAVYVYWESLTSV